MTPEIIIKEVLATHKYTKLKDGRTVNIARLDSSMDNSDMRMRVKFRALVHFGETDNPTAEQADESKAVFFSVELGRMNHNTVYAAFLDALCTALPPMSMPAPEPPKKITSADWEHIGEPNLFRLRVPGGWLVRMDYEVIHDTAHSGMVGGWDWRPALTFVPDDLHLWKIR